MRWQNNVGVEQVLFISSFSEGCWVVCFYIVLRNAACLLHDVL